MTRGKAQGKFVQQFTVTILDLNMDLDQKHSVKFLIPTSISGEIKLISILK